MNATDGITTLDNRIDYSARAEQLAQTRADIHAVVCLSSDGLLAGASSELPQEVAESIAAAVSTLYGIARGTLSALDPDLRPRTTTIEAEDGRFLLVVEAGTNLRLAVITHPEPELGSVVYQTSKLAKTFPINVAPRGSEGS